MFLAFLLYYNHISSDSFFSPWYLRWPESPPARTWSWSDRIWSHLLQWTPLSARLALWLLVQKCSVGSRWCRHNPPVYWPLQTEWREIPLLQPDGCRGKKKKEIITVTKRIILHWGRQLDTQGCISRDSLHIISVAQLYCRLHAHLKLSYLLKITSLWNRLLSLLTAVQACWRQEVK